MVEVGRGLDTKVPLGSDRDHYSLMVARARALATGFA
ncbi:hypothetical protein ACVIGB_003177 [Bradyrhizobium sp. USDA 4341]